MNITKKVVLMAHSQIADRLCETGHGEFQSAVEAEQFGEDFFKTLPWVVAHRVTRKPENGPEEVTYTYLTRLKEPRKGYAND